MKRGYLNKIGKRGRINIQANIKIARIWRDDEIDSCEIGLPGCLKTWTLQNVHRHKRSYYYDKPELLSNKKEVLRGCQNCHNLLEPNRELTEQVFLRLRGSAPFAGKEQTLPKKERKAQSVRLS